ncbi:MAG: hypothetical protein KY456_13560 [Chloroflexi bacterium]|nr:hypothetical protein [Chloroflexota bacterium]
MERTRFDQLTTTLGQSRSRRGALRLLGTATLSLGGFALLGADETDARKKRRRNKRGKKNRNGGTGTGGNQQDTGGNTEEPTEGIQCDRSNGTCCLDSDCRANEVCASVNGTRHCFCRPELVCGQVCCPAGATCNQATGTCAF